MKYLIYGLAALLIQSCSSAPVDHPDALISLREVEQIKLGEDSRASLEAKFGRPTREISISQNEYAIFFNRPYFKDRSISTQRASFVISKVSGHVLTAEWTPNGESESKNSDEMKSYFRGAQFKQKKTESKHSHVSTQSYTLNDPSLGISMVVSGRDHQVESVGFSLPAHRVVGSIK